jgi:hypothetical protein
VAVVASDCQNNSYCALIPPLPAPAARLELEHGDPMAQRSDALGWRIVKPREAKGRALAGGDAICRARRLHAHGALHGPALIIVMRSLHTHRRARSE